MELEGFPLYVIIIFGFGMILGVGLFILGQFQTSLFTETVQDSEIVLTESTQVLGYPPSIYTTKGYNMTWLNFDGIDDSLFIVNNSYQTVSYWVNDSNNNWMHVVNSGGILYEDNVSVGSLTLNAYYTNATGYFFGQNASNDYFIGNIDSIRFYNQEINNSVVGEIFTNGRE